MTWAIPRFDFNVEFAGASHTGLVRAGNEDVWKVDPGLGLFAVADGMGGHAAGDLAARITVDELGKALRQRASLALLDAYVAGPTLEARRAVFDLLEQAAKGAHDAVHASAARDAKRRGMGCTLDAAILLAKHALIVHVGDGRAYLSRPKTTIQLTHDHTLHGALLAHGATSPSDHPVGRGSALTNAVGRRGNLTVEDVFVELDEGDRLLLCSDGVHGEIVDEKVIGDLFRQGSTEDTAVALVNAALGRGGSDNATALVLQVGARRVSRSGTDDGLAARDAAFARHSALFLGVPEELVRRALGAAVQVEFEAGQSIPRFFASDRVAYVVLEGGVDAPNGWTLGPAGLVYPESLAKGNGKGTTLCRAVERTRALRIRRDDFREVCAADERLAAHLYERLSHSLARTGMG